MENVYTKNTNDIIHYFFVIDKDIIAKNILKLHNKMTHNILYSLKYNENNCNNIQINKTISGNFDIDIMFSEYNIDMDLKICFFYITNIQKNL